MRGDGGSGCAAGGCGGVSLVGLLATLLIMGLLGSQVVDEISGRDDDPPPVEPTRRPDPVAVAVTPATDLVDGSTVLVTSTAFPEGTRVTVSMCLDPSATTRVGEAACDRTSATSYAVLAGRPLREPFRVPRAITVRGMAHDCAHAPGRCRVVASASLTNREVAGGAPVTFRAGLPPVDPTARRAVPASDRLPITGTPDGTLAPETKVRVTARGFRPGEPLLVGWCSGAVEQDGVFACESVIDGIDAIDAMGGDFAATTDHAAADGSFTTSVTVRRRIDPAIGEAVDCTAEAGRCSIGVMAAADSRRSALLPYAVRRR